MLREGDISGRAGTGVCCRWSAAEAEAGGGEDTSAVVAVRLRTPASMVSQRKLGTRANNSANEKDRQVAIPPSPLTVPRTPTSSSKGRPDNVKAPSERDQSQGQSTGEPVHETGSKNSCIRQGIKDSDNVVGEEELASSSQLLHVHDHNNI